MACSLLGKYGQPRSDSGTDGEPSSPRIEHVVPVGIEPERPVGGDGHASAADPRRVRHVPTTCAARQHDGWLVLDKPRYRLQHQVEAGERT